MSTDITTTMIDERWAQIPGHHYSVSDQGRVRNDDTGNILRPILRSRLTTSVELYYEGGKTVRSVAQLVAEAFLPEPPYERSRAGCIIHKNGNPEDNRACNLRYARNRRCW